MKKENIVLFWQNQLEKLGERPAYRLKMYDRWLTRTWHEYGKKVKQFGMGLIKLGIKPGDVVAILASTREEWDIADRAVLSIGAIGVGIYHSNTPEQDQYIIKHSDARILVVENKEQWEKIEKIRSKIKKVENYVLMDPFGEITSDPKVISFDNFLELDRKLEQD